MINKYDVEMTHRDGSKTHGCAPTVDFGVRLVRFSPRPGAPVSGKIRFDDLRFLVFHPPVDQDVSSFDDGADGLRMTVELADGTVVSGQTRPIHLPGLWIRPDGASLGTLCLVPERNGMSMRMTSSLPPPVARPEPEIAEPSYGAGLDYSNAPGTEQPFLRDPFETPTEQEIDSLSIRAELRKQNQ
jgi:hypothetical protein